jgi:hypothetical protein
VARQWNSPLQPRDRRGAIVVRAAITPRRTRDRRDETTTDQIDDRDSVFRMFASAGDLTSAERILSTLVGQVAFLRCFLAANRNRRRTGSPTRTLLDSMVWMVSGCSGYDNCVCGEFANTKQIANN